MRKASLVVLSFFMLGLGLAPASAEQTPEQKARIQRLLALRDSLHPQYGDVNLPFADVTLHLGHDYYFPAPAETQKVLQDGWGNPPAPANATLGMIFKDKTSFLDADWGAVITNNTSGYVADDDSKTADYAALLQQMRSGEDEENKERSRQGYEPIHIVGWAQQPSYDPVRHTLVWARDLHFGTQTDDTLNYDIRVLGRRGFLSLNLVSSMSLLPSITTAAKELAAVADYKAGARYADFSPGSDTKSEYGLAGLVAAGVGLTLAKKLGFLALVLGFGKKFIVIIGMVFFGFIGKVKRLFSRGRQGNL